MQDGTQIKEIKGISFNIKERHNHCHNELRMNGPKDCVLWPAGTRVTSLVKLQSMSSTAFCSVGSVEHKKDTVYKSIWFAIFSAENQP